ncbi:quinol:cytochrome C oxidoreductase [Mucilaginibacter corticis]|uniref:Quinol:cytochrome C oxidoreductase n=1 Tax=Mucilaginibacter corticis TaxID=2597670 RepID=A0A556MSC4_9SPHI|nr:quinol:cytochrome C oxidoreductase [Mucilaginibacter corticis]TSJ42787.1 quinol:cytochrome C oxidoreductase [Mucilaginibacter corticis]
METNNSFNEQFEFSGKLKTYSLVAIVVGIVAIALGFFLNTEREFANLLLCGYYFTCVCIAGVFFCALQYAAQAGWSASILRVPQAFAKVLPYAAAILILVVALGIFTPQQVITEEGHQTIKGTMLYKEWAPKEITTKGSEAYNAVIAGKSGYLNIPFFFVRMAFYLIAYSILGLMLVKYSNNEDELGGMFNYKKSFNISAAFLAIFGFTVPLFAFDTIMSLDAHWFSTMFGWYNFAALWVSGLSVITLLLISLRKQGYFTWVTVDHLHNLGQLMFGFSIFWTYLWFAQFLLIYYANIPEEAAYFYKRWEPEFQPWFWLNIVVNFLAPFLVLMARDSKRAVPVLKTACIILICGHWLDYYIMIMPATVGPKGRGFGVQEIGTFLGFAGLFTFLFFTALSKFKSLVPKNHPFLQESLHHHI